MTSAPRLTLSSLNWTPTTPTLSEAVAATAIVPTTVVPEIGAVTATVGGVVSPVVVACGTSARKTSFRPEPFMSEVNRTYCPSAVSLAKLK